VFVTTHYMDEAEHCNTIGLIYSGKLIAVGAPTELKHKLSQYAIFEVRCSDPVEAMEMLQKEPWVTETSIFGSAFHVSISTQHAQELLIRQVLEKQHITVMTVTKIVPSLEDVFIHLIAEEDLKTTSTYR
jgi:ABC-2 type transport system ATP-binding protein